MNHAWGNRLWLNRLAHLSRCFRFGTGVAILCLTVYRADTAAVSSLADYAGVQRVFTARCLDCHASQEPEAKLVLESFEALMRGGENGPVVVAGRSDQSLLVKMIEGTLSRDGKMKIMPPGKRDKLTPEETQTIKDWIDAGASAPPPGTVQVQALVVPKITPKVAPRHPIRALAYAPESKLVAVGRDDGVQLLSIESRMVVRTLSNQASGVNALVFSSDGKFLFTGGGEAGVRGQVDQWNVADGLLIRSFPGHKDSVYSIALAPKGDVLATGSYDQKIKLWNTETGAELKTLSGHNGAVFDLAFRPDGQILASASADRTVKLWDVASGERRDTLAQSLKEVFTVLFSADGKRLFAAGADNRIRAWEISQKALETTNPLLEARFAHEGAILKLTSSPDGKELLSSASDQSVKIWDAVKLEERLHLELQPDWGTALVFISNKAIVVGRLDGSLQFYDATTAQVLPPPKPQLARTEPRGVQRGVKTRIKLIGSNLAGLEEVKFGDSRLSAELESTNPSNPNERWAEVNTPNDLPQAGYEIWGIAPNGETARLKLQIDDLPQVILRRGGAELIHRQDLPELPVSVWAIHERAGEAEDFHFHATAGQCLVFDLAAKRFGSKATSIFTLADTNGKVLQSSTGEGGSDPLMAYTFPAEGEYQLRVAELVLGGSTDHFYRLSIGSFAYVDGCYPLSVAVGRTSEVRLLGYNLPATGQIVNVQPDKPGDIELPLDHDKYRTRRQLKVITSESPEVLETEPNNLPDEAATLVAPCAVGGRLWTADGSADVDLFRFEAKAGETWILETMAAQRGSPADTRIEVLHADGKPVERLLLQAVRDSAVTFRGIDSDSTDCRVLNWEEMELNQYLFFQGEVVKLFRAPQGPDSGFLFYGANGKRRCYFDSSPAAHALDEPCYIVQPHPPGTKLVASGLPVFPLYYANDDDAERQMGTDSRLHFTAPANESYLVRVTDARGFGGDLNVYRLVVRRAEPDFKVSLNGKELTINAGSGQTFSVQAERMDGFDGQIEVSINHLPAGFSVSTPLVIEGGHFQAEGALHADLQATSATKQDWEKVEVIASASVQGQAFVKSVNNFGVVKLADKPKLFVSLGPEPALPSIEASDKGTGVGRGLVNTQGSDHPLEITLAPGQTVPALLKVQRNGHEELITFTVENLPHGVIVDNIGLNGVLIPKDQNERQIFLSAAKWVPETDRLCFAIENQAGRQTSLPVMLHVRRSPGLHAAVR